MENNSPFITELEQAGATVVPDDNTERTMVKFDGSGEELQRKTDVEFEIIDETPHDGDSKHFALQKY